MYISFLHTLIKAIKYIFINFKILGFNFYQIKRYLKNNNILRYQKKKKLSAHLCCYPDKGNVLLWYTKK